MRCVLLAALLSGSGAHAAADTKKPIQTKPVSAVADTQASARRQGAVNVSGINWACSGTHCSTSAMPSAVAAPLKVCQELAREVGAIRSFKVANHALNSKELQQCNSVVPAVAASQAPATGFAKPSPLPSNPAKKPSGAKGTPQTAAQGDGKAAPPAPQSPSAAKAPSAPGSRGYPVSIRTEGMTVTGTGPVNRPYTPKSIRTEGMTVTGTGPLAARPYTPKSIRTEGMTVTGTGSLR